MEGFGSPSYNEYDGIRISPAISPDSIRSAMNYKHKHGELYLASYHKCGSTWLQHIIMLILRKGQPIRDGMDYLLNTPFLEMAGPEALDLMNGPGVIKTHFPFNFINTSPEAKYIYITRNPKDCCVSFYYHTKKLFCYNFRNGTFDEFFELFINGKTCYCDYFDHLFSWYSHKDDANVHFVTYENLKKDTKGEALRLAKFIGEDYYQSLLNDDKYMENVLYYSSFEYLEKKLNEVIEFIVGTTSNPMPNIPLTPGVKYFFDFKSKYGPKKDTCDIKFVRKGIVGDWRNHFTPEQNERMDKWIKKRTEGSDVMSLWEDITV